MKPKLGPNTLAIKINKNQTGSIPIAPAPNKRRAEMSAVKTPSNATDFESSEPKLISRTNAKIASGKIMVANHFAFSLRRIKKLLSGK